ncbi:MAG: hypothetical protein RLZZ370_133 [Bacteroidota bacterium]
MIPQHKAHLWISLLGAVLFLPFLGSVHLFDWDEINFAEAAREMLVSGNYQLVQIDFQPFWEKPPLFIWLQVLSMKLFGVNEWAARLPNAIAGIITLNILYSLGSRRTSFFGGMFWVLLYAGSLTPHFYFKSGIMDPVFNLFMFLAIIQLYQSSRRSELVANYRLNFMLAGLFTGLAVLTKGPVALLLIGLTALIFYLRRGLRYFPSISELGAALLSFTAVVSVWFLPEWLRHGNWFMEKFITYQLDLFKGNMEAHEQPFWYHPLVLLVGCFPAAIFALPALKINRDRSSEINLFHEWMLILFWVVLVVFSITKTKIVHYSSMCWFPLSFMGMLTMWDIFRNQTKSYRWLTIILLPVGLLLGIAFTAVPLLGSSTAVLELIAPYIKDPFAMAALRSQGSWMGWEWVIGLLWIGGISFWTIRAMRRKDGCHALLRLPVLVMFFVPLYAIFCVPPIESQVQGHYIRQLKTAAGKGIRIWHDGFKSYAPYFYGQRKEAFDGGMVKAIWAEEMSQRGITDIRQFSQHEVGAVEARIRSRLQGAAPLNESWLVVVKTNKRQGYDTCRNMQLQGSAGGYLFYLRQAGK